MSSYPLVRTLDLVGASNEQPVPLEPGKLYRFTQRGRPQLLLLLCPCGCGEVVKLNLCPRCPECFSLSCENDRPTPDHVVVIAQGCHSRFSVRKNSEVL